LNGPLIFTVCVMAGNVWIGQVMLLVSFNVGMFLSVKIFVYLVTILLDDIYLLVFG